MATKCLQCAGEFKLASKKAKNGSTPELPEIRDAVTWAPSWQTTEVGPQTVIGCVAIPTCLEHLGASEKSPADRLAAMGLLPGRG